MPKTAYTYCQICKQACGLQVSSERNCILAIEPGKENPRPRRDFCVKGATAAEVVEHPDRILTPMQRVDGRYVKRSYAEAITAVGSRRVLGTPLTH